METENLRGTLAPRPEKAGDFHLEQLGTDTVKHLLALDLANKPDAQKPLIEFLRAMGVSDEEIATSGVAKAMMEQKAFGDTVRERGGEAADFVAHQ